MRLAANKKNAPPPQTRCQLLLPDSACGAAAGMMVDHAASSKPASQQPVRTYALTHPPAETFQTSATRPGSGLCRNWEAQAGRRDLEGLRQEGFALIRGRSWGVGREPRRGPLLC